MDCDGAGFATSELFPAMGVPAWYVERGRSRPNLEPVTELPRAKGIEFGGFGEPDALGLGGLMSVRSIVGSGNAIDLIGEADVPGCGRRLRRFGWTLP